MTRKEESRGAFDVFVSYARADNRDGRVDGVIERLRPLLEQRLGRTPGFWIDRDNLDDMDDWRLRIAEGLRRCSTMMAFVSSAYFASEYCRSEYAQFTTWEIGRSLLEFGGGLAVLCLEDIPGVLASSGARSKGAWLDDIASRQHTCDLRTSEAREVNARLEKIATVLARRITWASEVAKSPCTVPAFNPRLVGRIGELRQIRLKIEESPFGVLLSIHGVAGMGKSELAYAYAQAYAAHYPGGRYLVHAAGSENLRTIVADLASEPELEADESEGVPRGPREKVQAVRRAFATRGRALLVLDNVTNLELLDARAARELFPADDSVHILATTRLHPSTLPDNPAIALDELAVEDAVELMQRHLADVAPIEHRDCLRAHLPEIGRGLGRRDLADLRAIARIVGGHPLSCEVIALYLLNAPSDSIGDYRARLEADVVESLEFAAQHTDVLTGERYRTQLRTNPEPLIRRLLEPTLSLLTPPVLFAVRAAASMAARSPSLSWVKAVTSCEFADELEEAGGAEDGWRRIRTRLIRLRLLIPTEAPGEVRMHVVIQQVIRAGMEPETYDALLGHILTHAYQWVAKRSNAYGLLPLADDVSDYVAAAVTLTEWSGRVPPDKRFAFGQMCFEVGWRLGKCEPRIALNCLRGGAEVLQMARSTKDSHTAIYIDKWYEDTLSWLSIVAKDLGLHEEFVNASTQLVRARESSRWPLSNSHETAAAHQQAGYAALQVGDLAEARRDFRRGLRLARREDQKHNTALLCADIAGTYQEKNRQGRALLLLRIARQLVEHQLGSSGANFSPGESRGVLEHSIANIDGRMGMAHWRLGEHQEAESFMRASIASYDAWLRRHEGSGSVTTSRRDRAAAIERYGTLLISEHRFREAADVLEVAYAEMLDITSEAMCEITYIRDLFIISQRLAWCYDNVDQPDLSLRCALTALEAARTCERRTEGEFWARRDVILAHRSVATCEGRRGNKEECLRLRTKARQLIAEYRENGGSMDPALLSAEAWAD